VIARVRTTPAALVCLLVASTVAFLAWTVILPPLQDADENAHIAYVQKIVDAGRIPWTHGSVGSRDDPRTYSTELRTAQLWAGLEPLRGNLSARPLWTSADVRAWERVAARLPPGSRSDGGQASTFVNPPAYYLYASAPYAIFSSTSFFDRAFVVRLANLPFLLLTVLFTWLLAGEVFGRRRALQAVAAGVVALQPLLVSIAAGVTPDAMLAAAWTAALYLMARLLREGPRVGSLGALVGLCVLAPFTHGRGLPLLAPAAMTLVLLALRRRRLPRGALVTAVVVGAVVLVVGAVAYAGHGHVSFTTARELGSYLWQFYLPKLSFMDPSIGGSWGFRGVYVDRFFGTFGQLEVTLPGRLLRLLHAAVLAGLVALVVAVVVRWRAVAAHWRVAAVLVVAVLADIVSIHLVAFRTLSTGSTDPVFTGRYLLPIASLFGLAIAFVMSALPRRLAVPAGALALSAAVFLQFAALGALTTRFYG
jgi:4-amino-4-deoxy-L-arabinose transferase-like glycosyltransferase